MLDYNQVKSIEKSEFDKRRIPSNVLQDDTKFSVTTAEVKERIERILDVNPGTLGEEIYYFQKGSCANGHDLSMYDFVFTALIDAGHSKSLVLHTLVGNKYVLNAPRRVRCSTCSDMSVQGHAYSMEKYACGSNP